METVYRLTRCHSCARPFEIEIDNEPETFEQYGRPYFELQNDARYCTCPECGRKHSAGYSMEIVEVRS